MNALSSIACQAGRPEVHSEFLLLYPIVQRHARVVFRRRHEVDKEELTAEAVAAAFASYVTLKARGKDPIRDFPSVMAKFAVLRAQDDRLVGGKTNSKDVLSSKAQRRRGFKVESLSMRTRSSVAQRYSQPLGQNRQDLFEERFQEDWRTPVPDQVAFRLDFAAFLQTLSVRDRGLMGYLSMGHSGKQAAEKFHVSDARVTQLRQEWQRRWIAFQGDESSATCSTLPREAVSA
jgi:hypothetical protein